MRFALYDEGSGQILRTLVCTLEQAQASCASGQQVLEVNDAVRDDTHYIEQGTPVAMPPRPDGHRWDWPTKAWVPDVDAARAQLHLAIERERDRRITEPIAYDDSRVDADERAQKNVSDKLAEITSREAAGTPMPAQMLVWRDADNLTRTFADQATYKVWLQGLTIAIASRGTEAYAWSWQKKADADACTTLEELQAIDLT